MMIVDFIRMLLRGALGPIGSLQLNSVKVERYSCCRWSDSILSGTPIHYLSTGIAAEPGVDANVGT